MTGQTVLIAINILAGVLALGIAAHTWNQRKDQVTLAYTLMMVCVAGWAFMYAGVHLAPDLATALTFHKLKHIFSLLLPVAWFAFTVLYTGIYHGLKRTTLGFLLVLPTIGIGLALTNPMHNLLYRNPRIADVVGIPELVDDLAPMGMVMILYSVGLLLFGLYILVQSSMRVIGTYRVQVRVVLIIGLMVLLSVLLEHALISPLQHINLTPSVFALVGVVILRYLLRMDELRPIAYDTVINNLPDAMAVLDTQQRLITANPSFLLMFSLEEADIIGKTLLQATPILTSLVERISPEARITETIYAHERYIEAACAPIQHRSQLQGYIILCHDITLERKAQDSLMDSERRYRALFDHSNDAIFIINMKGTILLANQPATTLLGAPLSQILNKPLTQYIKLTEMLTIHQQIRQLLSGNTPPIAEQTLIAVDGTEIPIEMSVTLVQDGAGQPLSLQMVARDIRERKRAQGVITSERYLLRTLFDSMPDSIFTIDRDGAYTLVNEAHLRRLGLSSADDFIGKQPDDFYDPDTAQTMNKRSMKVIDADEPDNNSEEQRGPDTWYMVTRAPLHDESGSVSGALIVERDISEIKIVQDELHRRLEQLTILRQADEEVAHSLNMESVGLIALDAALRLSRADAGYIAMLEKNEDLDIAPILRVSHMIGGYNRFTVGDILPQNGIVGRAIDHRESQLVLDVRLDADYIPDVVNAQSVMALPIIVQEEFLGVIQLVSRQRDVFTQDTFQFISLLAYRIAIALDNARLYEVAQQQLQQVLILNESLRDLEEIKTDMIRIASHDLKNPLGIIDGYLNMLEMDRENFAPIYLEYFEAMQRAVHRMNTILSDILSLERVQQRAAGTYTIPVDLYSLVVKALEEFMPYFKNKAQNITIDSPESQALVLGDEAQLYEAISNLISNAIKYTPEGGNIAVRLYYDDNLWMFEVQDDGYGIPEDRQKNLFEAFYRAKAQGTEQIEGTGLGLHLVKNIIERHGGEMFFHSIYQHGSLFGFRLQPANSVNNGQSHDRDTLPENEAQGEANTNPPTFFDD